MKKSILLLVLVPVFMLVACGETKKDDDIIIVPPVPETVNIFENSAPGNNKQYPDNLDSYAPTLFSKASFKEDSSLDLGTGVVNKTYSFNLNSGNKVIANTIEIDLKKAAIDTNFSKTGVSTLNNQLQDFELSENKKVTAIMNADFFATGSGTSVNAYAKNNEIIKSAHNDNGIYDYTDLTSDIPASKPMLFGISGEEARIAPIITNGTVEETIKSKLSNVITYIGSDAVQVEIKEKIVTNASSISSLYDYNLINSNMSVAIDKDCQILTIKKNKDSKVITSGTIEKISIQKLDGNKTFSNCEDYFYIIASKDKSLNVTTETQIGYSINSSDETRKYYQHVIGGRQSLVENGNIAQTVTLENSNGAQRTNVPRSGIGVVNQSKVIICAVEALRYGKFSASDSDGYGLNLPEFAEVMRYLGCYDAMNFDGGGSTQLIVKNNEKNENSHVIVRSSDYGTYNIDDGRKVYSSIIVRQK
jgi:hypothetical protein